MCVVNEYLQPFYLKRGIFQLTDYEYDMSTPNFVNTW